MHLLNLAPPRRRHHQAKHAPGWHLSQDQPGRMTWQLPHGRICSAPASYIPSEQAQAAGGGRRGSLPRRMRCSGR